MNRYFIYLFIICTLLIIYPKKANAEYIDLEGADIIGQPMACLFDDEVRGCVLVKKNNQHYQVVFDQKGEYKIYKVEVERRDGKLVVVKPQLLWRRGTI